MSWSFKNRFSSSSPREKQQVSQWKYPFQSIISEQKELILETLIPSILANKNELFPSVQAFFQTDEEFDQIIASCFFFRTTKDSSKSELKGRAAYILHEDKLVYINPYKEQFSIDINASQLGEIIKFFPEEFNVFKPASKDKLNLLNLLTNHYPRFLIDEIGDLVLNLRTEDLFRQVQDLMRDLLLPIEQSPNWDNLWRQKNTQSDPYLQDLIAGAFFSKMLDFLSNRLKEQGTWNEQTRQQIAAIKAVCSCPTNIFFLAQCETLLQHEIERQMSRMILAGMQEQEKSTSLQKTIANNIFFRLLDPLTAHKIYLRELRSVQRIFENAISEELLCPYHLKESPTELPTSQALETTDFFDLMHSAFTEYQDEGDSLKNKPNSALIVRPRAYISTPPIEIPFRSNESHWGEEDPIEKIAPLKKTGHSIEKSFRPKIEIPTPKLNNPQSSLSSGSAFFNQANSSRSTEEEGFTLNGFPPPTGM